MGLRLAHGGELVQRRVPDPEPRIEAADLDGPELRVHERAPRREAAAAVVLAIPPRELLEVLAGKPLVVLHELRRARHAHALEQIPQLDHVRERAALVVCVLAYV